MTRFSRTYFVYGTLRPGGRYWPNIEDLVVEYEPAALDGFSLWDLPDGYPAILGGNGKVFGDLLYVRQGHERTFAEIADEIEEFDANDPGCLYLRQPVEVTRLRALDKPSVPAETYVFNEARAQYLRASGTEVPNGDWREFVAEGEGLQ